MIPYRNKLNNNIHNLQNNTIIEAITIGRLAPDFVALSTEGYIRLSDYRGKWLLLSSHPEAFGPVSTTEIISLAQNYSEFQRRNVEILGLTTDNNSSNLGWVYDIFQKTGITIPFPILDDANLNISEIYGMLNPDRLYGETVRNTFLINPEGKINAIQILPTSSGRSTKELLRIIDSLQIAEQYNLYTPADWDHTNPLVLPIPTNYEELIERTTNQANLGIYCPSWYVCYQDLPVEALEEPSASPQ